ncbi:hypothetical protein MKW98_004549, partial [Papaver atlanticum]
MSSRALCNSNPQLHLHSYNKNSLSNSQFIRSQFQPKQNLKLGLPFSSSFLHFHSITTKIPYHLRSTIRIK